MSYFPAISQNVVADNNNSHTADIGPGVTWEGSSTSTIGVAGIQFMFTASQNCIIYVDQSTDNTNWDITDSYEFFPLRGGLGLTTQAVGSYYRIRVKNVSTSNASNVRLGAALCPIVEAVPRALDEHGNMKVGIFDMEDHANNSMKISPLGDIRVAEPYRLVGQSFKGTTIDTAFWTPTNGGTASGYALANAVVTLTSGTDFNGYGQITSAQKARFVAGIPNIFRGLIRIPVLGITGSKQRWGAFTVSSQAPVDGVFFTYDDSDILRVNHCHGGTIEYVASGAFNGEVNNYTMDTNVHQYEITYYLGKLQFFIDGVLIHTFIPTDHQLSQAWALPVAVHTVNEPTGNISADIELWIAMINRIGRPDSDPIFKHQADAVTASVLKSGAGRLRRILYGKHPDGGTITLYDALTATNTIAVIAPPNGASPTVYDLDLNFYTGLTYTTSTAGMDVTFIYE